MADVPMSHPDPSRTQPEAPLDRAGRPDDRFDGTDSGHDGWDTPYPPGDAASESPRGSTDPALADHAEAETAGPGSTSRRAATGSTADVEPGHPDDRGRSSSGPSEPARWVDGTAYETDGPDEPAGTPQR